MKHSIKNHALLLAIAGLIILYSCEKDEAPTPFITAGTITIDKTEVNCCELSSGPVGTQFSYSIPYEASEGIQIAKAEYTSTRSNGSKTSAEYSTATDGSDGTINGYTTIVFTSSSWVEHSYTLVSSSGIKSNPSVIRFNRPSGAN